MNALGLQLVWMGLQVSSFCLAGIALYLIARRRGPASGAWSAGAALALAVVVSVVATSPWPRWWSLAPSNTTQSAQLGSETQPTDDTTGLRLAPGLMSGPIAPSDRRHTHGGNSNPATVQRSTWSSLLPRAMDELLNSAANSATAGWRWPAWLACVLVAGVAISMARLLIAVIAAHHFRSSARPVGDEHANELLHEFCDSQQTNRSIELRETSLDCSPSTIGWRRPVIVMPSCWRNWNEHELRAVLAHEVAHVARNDFAVALVSQVGVALHFYNPLVRFLARRLRLEQEMAADVCGAQFAGGRQRYLTTLAEMALRTNDAPLSWAARPFLPTRGTLMRRIEMLHREKSLPSLAISRSRRTMLAVMLFVVAAIIAGVRGPQGGAIVAATLAEVQAQGSITVAPTGLDFIPPDAQFVFALRPAELVKIESLKPFREMLSKIGAFESLDVPLERLDTCTHFSAPMGDPERVYKGVVLRSKDAHDWNKFGQASIGKNEQVTANGQTYFQSTGELLGPMSAYWLPDDRTIVLSRKDAISKLFALKGGDHQPDWAHRWASFATNPVVAMISPRALAETMQQSGGKVDQELLNEFDGPAFFAGKAGADGDFQFEGEARCKSAVAASKLLLAATESLKSMATSMHRALAENAGAEEPFANMMLGLLDATELTVENSSVLSRTTVDEKISRKVRVALGGARIAAARARSANNLKQIGIGFWNYHDVHKQFPPATIIGPDGKTPHSWRVALLPFIDKQELYDQYRLNEPWDSEHNRKLIEVGANIYRVPTDELSNECGYFALVGPSTAFDPDKAPISVRTVVDGTSMTMGIVEAKRDIPWTKPEDIAYDPSKPMPKFGGFFPGGFDTQFLDGSVHFLSDKLDQKVLREIISIDGREPVDRDKLHP